MYIYAYIPLSPHFLPHITPCLLCPTIHTCPYLTIPYPTLLRGLGNTPILPYQNTIELVATNSVLLLIIPPCHISFHLTLITATKIAKKREGTYRGGKLEKKFSRKIGKLRGWAAATEVGVIRGTPHPDRPLKRKQIAKNSVQRSVGCFGFIAYSM